MVSKSPCYAPCQTFQVTNILLCVATHVNYALLTSGICLCMHNALYIFIVVSRQITASSRHMSPVFQARLHGVSLMRMNRQCPTVEQLDNAVQAVDTAVAAAVADDRVKTKEEVEAASAAKKAAADQQLLRELEDKTQALTNQLNSATEQLRSTETALRSGYNTWPCMQLQPL